MDSEVWTKNEEKEVTGVKDDLKLCPLLAIARAEGENEDSAVCMGEHCAWWLPEYSKRIPGSVVGGRCAVSALAYQVWNIADK